MGFFLFHMDSRYPARADKSAPTGRDDGVKRADVAAMEALHRPPRRDYMRVRNIRALVMLLVSQQVFLLQVLE
jgi:hypothetical protein